VSAVMNRRVLAPQSYLVYIVHVSNTKLRGTRTLDVPQIQRHLETAYEILSYSSKT
jgi:hypothetical protein